MSTTLTPADVRAALLAAADPDRAAFNARLAPTVAAGRFLGVPMARMRQLARTITTGGTFAAFAAAAPHASVEENMVHMLSIATITDPHTWREELLSFVPCVDNWMVADCVGMDVLRRRADTPQRRAALATATTTAQELMGTSGVYSVRVGLVFGIQCLRAQGESGWDEGWEAALRGIDPTVAQDPMAAKAIGWFIASLVPTQPDIARTLLEEATWLGPAGRRAAVEKIIASRRSSDAQRQWARQVPKKWA